MASNADRDPTRESEEEHTATTQPDPEEPARSEPGNEMGGILEAHNRFRGTHCAAPLTWSEELADEARAWAKRLTTDQCTLGHDPNTKHGENLAFFTPSGRVDGAGVAKGWYDEVADYDFRSPGFSMHTGHFTQVVWTDTRELGCAVARCGGGDLWVCRYGPSGNYRGQFRDKVLPKSCKK